VSMCAVGQTERHCGKVGGRSNELAPANDSPGVYTAGQGHSRPHAHLSDAIGVK